VGKNKKIDKGKWKINGEIKIVESPTREFTFVEGVYTRYISPPTSWMRKIVRILKS
jgi:hypothetical protein